MQVLELGSRDLPASMLAGDTLLVSVPPGGTHTVSVDSSPFQVTVTEDGVATGYDPLLVSRVTVLGGTGRNVVQNNTALDCVLVGGPRGDTLFGGTGRNTILPGGGGDTVYALLGSNVIDASGGGPDRVFTNFPAAVLADRQDLVVRFFNTGRTPGSGFIGLDETLGDGVLYITPGNAGSRVTLDPAGPGKVKATYDLGTGAGPLTAVFTGVRAVSYFGGAGDDVYTNNTRLVEAAYGSAGNDTLTGGRGAFSLLKGSGGDDTLTGRARANDVSGNGGADTLTVLSAAADVFRTDALDTLVGRKKNDVVISP